MSFGGSVKKKNKKITRQKIYMKNSKTIMFKCQLKKRGDRSWDFFPKYIDLPELFLLNRDQDLKLSDKLTTTTLQRN